jgi:hypothetical protein
MHIIQMCKPSRPGISQAVAYYPQTYSDHSLFVITKDSLAEWVTVCSLATVPSLCSMPQTK